MLQIVQGYKQYGPKILFDDVIFAINAGEHVGVIGPNGAGKTTLFKILAGQENLDAGRIVKTQGLRIGYLEQETDWGADSCENYLATHCTKPIWELKKLGVGLGLEQEHFDVALQVLSGGYRMRMKLLYLIGVEPDLMLLDEPTNYLDLESILALENFLQGHRGAFLLISHDREFLRRTAESTLEVEGGNITKFPGTIDDYFEEKAQLATIVQAQAANTAAKRKQVQDFVDRFGAKASKAKQAQSRMKQLAKMEVIEVKPLQVRAAIRIPPPTHTGKETLLLENANLGYSDHTVLSNVSLRLERGARVGVVGFNGAGKSTLLKSLSGRLPLKSGRLKLGLEVSLSYFAQHTAEELNLDHSVFEAMQSGAHKDVIPQEILSLAGSLLFSGDDVKKPVKVLSGGEKARVALGQMLLKKSQVLIMDEPTNHLDFETVEAMTAALAGFAGTLVVVSHDRGFIRRVSTRILEIRDGHAEVYPGSYDDYVWSLEKGALKSRVRPAEKAKAPPAAKPPPKISPAKSSQNQIRQLETRIRQLEAKVLELNKQVEDLNAALLQAKGAQAQEVAKQLAEVVQQISSHEDEILNAMEQL